MNVFIKADLIAAAIVVCVAGIIIGTVTWLIYFPEYVHTFAVGLLCGGALFATIGVSILVYHELSKSILLKLLNKKKEK